MKFNKSYLLAITATLLWGGSPAIMKFTLEQVPLFSLAFIRFFTASIILAIIVYTIYRKDQRNLKIKKVDLPRFFFAGFFGITLNISLFFAALKIGSAVNASVLIAAIPIFSIILAHTYLKEKFTLHLILASVVAIAGLVFVVGKPFGTTSITQILGGVLMILSSIAEVIYEIISKKLLTEYSGETLAFYSMFIGSLAFLPFAIFEFLQNPAWITHITLPGMLGILYGIFGASLVAYWAFMKGLAKLPTGQAAFFFYLDPISGAILAMIILGEKLTIQTLVGALLILSAVFLAEYHRKKHPLPEKL